LASLDLEKKFVFLLPRIEPQFLERPACNLVTKLDEVFTLVPSTGSCFYSAQNMTVLPYTNPASACTSLESCDA